MCDKHKDGDGSYVKMSNAELFEAYRTRRFCRKCYEKDLPWLCRQREKMIYVIFFLMILVYFIAMFLMLFVLFVTAAVYLFGWLCLAYNIKPAELILTFSARE